MLIKAVCYFIIPMIIDMVIYLCPVMIFPPFQRRKLRYTIIRKDGSKEKSNVVVDLRKNKKKYPLSHRSESFLRCSDRVIRYCDVEEEPLTRRPLTLSDSGERIKLRGADFVLIKFSIGMLVLMELFVLPMLLDRIIMPVSERVSMIPETVISHAFQENTIHDDAVRNVLLVYESEPVDDCEPTVSTMILSVNERLRTVKFIRLHGDLRVDAYVPSLMTVHDAAIDESDPNYRIQISMLPKTKWLKTRLEDVGALGNFSEAEKLNVLVDCIEYNLKTKIDDVIIVDNVTLKTIQTSLDTAGISLTDLQAVIEQKQSLLFCWKGLASEKIQDAVVGVRTTLTGEELAKLAEILVKGYYTIDFDCSLPFLSEAYERSYREGTTVYYRYVPLWYPSFDEQVRTVIYGEKQ